MLVIDTPTHQGKVKAARPETSMPLLHSEAADTHTQIAVSLLRYQPR